ncbi:serine acetyltransferase, plasmid [Methyloglobulus morosus KoM1]|uniref:serine O-acetyltransferase n=1 Tax=Methyloglobulus morosus KoM1 TaxID=1116472 RepID=V5B640_9GAMM|nr:serine O-acetyltransferase EpsC [Methyloglobulus morosus]ESS68705.1 serine acetyltransferase, plasmid [Methyloglobulus morosus KoM1]
MNSIYSKTSRQWGVEECVASLRQLRLGSLESRRRLEHPPRLPSRKILAGLVDQLGAALFPHRLGKPDLSAEAVDYFVGHILSGALNDLYQQIRLELIFKAEQQGLEMDCEIEAEAITHRFTTKLPNIRAVLDTDLQAAYEGDPSAHNIDEVLVCYPGLTAVVHYRLAHALHELGVPLVARIISEIAHSATGIDIHPGAQIGNSFFVDHGTGVVIGETAILGKHVRLYQAVTLGAKRFTEDENGVLVKGYPRHPIVEDNVVIYAGATLLGRITIGAGSVIGGNVWLTQSVPPGSQITQAKAHQEQHEVSSIQATTPADQQRSELN